jgi:hypothetical protein
MSITQLALGSDLISSLPTDKNPLNSNEEASLETFFVEQKKFTSKMGSDLTGIVILLFLFVVFNLPMTDSLFGRVIKERPYLLIFAKGVVFVVVYYVIKNINIVRKK